MIYGKAKKAGGLRRPSGLHGEAAAVPTLSWIGKDKITSHHRDVPFRVLERRYACGEADSGNMVVRGDNLDALKALLPQYEGSVKCVYIDPPYNTGNEGWVYNDSVNDPKIKKWLGEAVGREGEDLSRHDKWLCMMYHTRIDSCARVWYTDA
jgi:adenine-specific DNA-methyltransferase